MNRKREGMEKQEKCLEIKCGCEGRKCVFWDKDRKICEDQTEWINEAGDLVCRYQNGAVQKPPASSDSKQKDEIDTILDGLIWDVEYGKNIQRKKTKSQLRKFYREEDGRELIKEIREFMKSNSIQINGHHHIEYTVINNYLKEYLKQLDKEGEWKKKKD